uniref:NADH-ubiquinone oxidoreductase chain 2 n=1 Tax=Austrofundulus transilis TaxID=60311 RepID=Q3ZFV2_9TELE|nr:NADH dehydrogenase subunit 2 [Austrofundulus transilis]AAY99331.1 NADH dehydrogenase subunit 2 [Austrofundulus transilis]
MNPYISITITAFSMIMGTLITTSSSHWLIAWMGLEINTFAIIPLMTQKHAPRAMEATIKYFIIQTTATAVLLFASISNAWMLGQWDIQQMNHPFTITMIYLALALKLGLAPLHAWFPEVIQGLSLMTGFILATWQKLAPISLMLQLSNYYPKLMTLLGLLSILMGGWGGLSQTQLRKILGYSSIANLGWMTLVLQHTPMLALSAFILYVVMTFFLFFSFWLTQSTSINALSTSWTKTPIISATSTLILLSLGGLPPLTGFLPKMLILAELTEQNLALTATMAALSALLSLYFYLRLSYALALTTPPNNLPAILPWRINFTKPTLLMAISSTLSLLLLPISPMLSMYFIN